MDRLSMFYKPLLTIMLCSIGITPAEAQARRKVGNNSAPSAQWMGQTGKDFIGKSTSAGSDNIQDIQIKISGFPLSRLSNLTLKGNGGGEWQWVPGGGQPPGGWAMHLIADTRPGQAELFFQSDQVETGREFELKWTVNGQPEQTIYFQGGKADPTKPVSSAEITARWIGQSVESPVDQTNRSAAVGPDNLEDAVIELSKLSERDSVTSVDVESSDGQFHWSFGQNPEAHWSAELVRKPENSSKALLILSVPPPKDGKIQGKPLKIRLKYASSGVSEAAVVAGQADGDKVMPKPETQTKFLESKIISRWVGHGQKPQAGPGAIQIEISNIPSRFRAVAAILTDSYGTTYTTSAGSGKPPAYLIDAKPLIFERVNADKAFIGFLPVADLADQSLNLRLVDTEGANLIVPIKGGKTYLSKRVPGIRPGRATAKPGNDLQTLVNRGGTILLGDGDYKLDRPLLIDKPTRLEAAPNAHPSLTFSKGDSTSWTAAVKIRSGGVSLSGFTVKFSGAIPWSTDVAYGPAVIATTDNRDTGFNHDDPHWGITLNKLTVYGPPTPPGPDPKQPPEAIKLVRILNGHFGLIEGCIFKGGTIHLQGGPWAIRQNRHDGPLAGSFAYDAFAVTKPLALSVESNRIEPMKGAGKLWRFINLTQFGTDIRVVGNVVQGVGPMLNDTIADMNANEVLLTESYRLKFEGQPAQISDDGSTVFLPPKALHQTPQPGDNLAILTGPNAGQFHLVRQVMSDSSILVDPPLGPQDRATNPPFMSLAKGFREVLIDRNTIDASGSKTAFNLVLAGNHFGTEVTGNTLIGGGESLRLTSFPTEFPQIWGWSHAPMCGIRVTGNTVSGAAKPGRLAVDQGPTIKTSQGRVYYSVEISGNSFEPSEDGPAVQLGDPGTIDPSSLRVNLFGNKSSRSNSEIRVVSGQINGKPLTATSIPVTTGSGRPGDQDRSLKR